MIAAVETLLATSPGPRRKLIQINLKFTGFSPDNQEMEEPENLISLIYLSAASVPFSKQDLVELLTKSRENNSALGITGMLLFKDGNFLQVLEGEEKKVHALYQKIAQDRMHRRLITLSQMPCTERAFPDWSMGFHDLRSPEVAITPGFTPFLDTSLTAADFATDPGRAKRLLLLFKEEKLLSKGAGAG